MNIKGSKILITGYGFIGKALYQRLTNEGAKVQVIERQFFEKSENFIEGHVQDTIYRIDLNINKPDLIIHTASPSSIIDFNKNRKASIDDSIEAFNAVVGFCAFNDIKLIYPSTSSLYGVKNDYAKVKEIFEQISESFYSDNHYYPRVFAGYGPGEERKEDKASVIFQWLLNIKRGEPVVIYGNGSQARDFVYIDDIAEEFINAIKRNKVGSGDIGTGVSTTFNELVGVMRMVTKKDFELRYVDKPQNYLEVTKCEKPLKKFTKIEEGVRKTWNYILENNL